MDESGRILSQDDDPVETVRALYDSGYFDEMKPIEIDGGMANPLTYAKRALDDAKQSGAAGRAGRARCKKLLTAMEEIGVRS